jgi:hypothetical protein
MDEQQISKPLRHINYISGFDEPYKSRSKRQFSTEFSYQNYIEQANLPSNPEKSQLNRI